MSRSRSASLEIVPPATSNARNPAIVMGPMFKNNQKNTDDDVDDADADAEVDEIDEQAPAPKAAVLNPPNAPTPCERCVRTHKQCKGMAGARCEYCKRLKQKCSNSSGPARGKSASAKKAADSTGTPKATATKSAGPSTQSASHLKRKFPVNSSTPLNGDTDNHSLDGEGSIVDDEGHEPPPRLNKKRRISKGNGGVTRSQLTKIVTDMEGSMKRIQSTVTKELEKIANNIKSLNAKINEMDEE